MLKPHITYLLLKQSQLLDHVDNPVYLYQNGGRKDNEHLLNNTPKILNNLQKTNNLDRTRRGLPCCSTDDEDLPKGKRFIVFIMCFFHLFFTQEQADENDKRK